MLLFVTLVVFGLLSAVVLAAAYWLLLTACEPLLQRFKQVFNPARTTAFPYPVMIPVSAGQFYGGGQRMAGLQIAAAALVVGVVSVPANNIQPIPGCFNLLITANVCHIS
jgi:hypothetical protein